MKGRIVKTNVNGLSLNTISLLGAVRSEGPNATTRDLLNALRAAGLTDGQEIGHGGSWSVRIRGLADNGLVRSRTVRNPDPGPPRIRLWTITARGRRALERAWSILAEFEPADPARR